MHITHCRLDETLGGERLIFSSDYATSEFRHFGMEFKLPMDSKKLADLLRAVAKNLDEA